MDQDTSAPIGGDTVFEVGSVTKVFTTLLLSELDKRGDISLDGPAGECLPFGGEFPVSPLSNRPLITHRQAIAFKADDYLRGIGEQNHIAHAQIDEDLCAHAIID
jgi:CubicO group peptidase (beta-lactamase class C family)